MNTQNTMQAKPPVPPALADAVAKVSAAISKLATANSSCFGADCYLHAALAVHLLQDLNVFSRIAVGAAAWRVGDGDGDVISHLPGTKSVVPQGKIGIAYHAWLAIGSDWILDLTTYQLPSKAKSLDEIDGGTTDVRWAPAHLLLHSSEVRPFKDVAQLHHGLAFYQEIKGADVFMAGHFQLDPADLTCARMIMLNPTVNVVGQRQMVSDGATT